MHKITFFSTKGGTGRTTCTMALACGLRAQGKRVMVVDCTGKFEISSLTGLKPILLRWYERMQATGTHDDALMLTHCYTADHVAAELAIAAEFRMDIVLFDLPSYPHGAQNMALAHADLVITPAMAPNEAQFGSEGIHHHYEFHERVIGLISGAATSPGRATQTRQAFQTDRVFRAELPFSQAFEDLVREGDLGALVARRVCDFDATGFAYYKSAEAAWRAVGYLTFEVHSALDGFYLTQYEPSRSGLQLVG